MSGTWDARSALGGLRTMTVSQDRVTEYQPGKAWETVKPTKQVYQNTKKALLNCHILADAVLSSIEPVGSQLGGPVKGAPLFFNQVLWNPGPQVVQAQSSVLHRHHLI